MLILKKKMQKARWERYLSSLLYYTAYCAMHYEGAAEGGFQKHKAEMSEIKHKIKIKNSRIKSTRICPLKKRNKRVFTLREQKINKTNRRIGAEKNG